MNDTQILDYVLSDLEHSTINSALLRIALANMIKKFRDEEQKVTVEDRLKKLEAALPRIEKGFEIK